MRENVLTRSLYERKQEVVKALSFRSKGVEVILPVEPDVYELLPEEGDYADYRRKCERYVSGGGRGRTPTACYEIRDAYVERVLNAEFELKSLGALTTQGVEERTISKMDLASVAGKGPEAVRRMKTEAYVEVAEELGGEIFDTEKLSQELRFEKA